MKGLKNFVMTFAIAVLVIGIVAVFVTGAIKGILLSVFDRDTDELTQILNSSQNASDVTGGNEKSENTLAGLEGDSFTMLLVCTDRRNNLYDYMYDENDVDMDNKEVGYLEKTYKYPGASNICLVRCSKEFGEYVFTPIAPNTNVSIVNDGVDTLYNIYGYYGFDFFKGKIESITGIKVDYWLSVDCTDISAIITKLGAVFCSVPCDIFTDGVNYVSATGVSRAKQAGGSSEYKPFLEICDDYIGPSCMGMLLFRDYTNGIEDELTITDSFTKGIFTNYAKLSADGKLTMWKNLEEYFDTNITEDFFKENSELLGAYSIDIARSLAYPGIFKAAANPDEAVFEPNVQRAVEDFSKYRIY